MELTTKVNDKKVLATNHEFDISLLCNKRKVSFIQLNRMLNNYLHFLRDTSIIKDASKLNNLIKFDLFSLEVNVNDAFGIYNECVRKFQPGEYEPIDKRLYDPKNSINFSPSNLK